MPSYDPQHRAAALRREVHTHNHRYHVLQSPLISDEQFDKLMRQLQRIEAQYPELITSDSPTQRVGGAPSQKFQKVKHPTHILSLGNANGVEETRAWFERIARVDDRVEAACFVVEPKIDGLTVILHYREGLFVQGATRGFWSRRLRNSPLFCHVH